MVKRVIMNLHLSKASGPDSIPVVVLKNCEPEFSYILLNSSISVLRSLVFLIVGRIHWWSLYLRMLGKALQLKTTILLVFEKLTVDHLEKCDLFSDFQYCFRSSRSTADLLTVVSDRITRAFNRSGATRAVALDISKAFDRVWYAGLLHKLKAYGISG